MPGNGSTPNEIQYRGAPSATPAVIRFEIVNVRVSITAATTNVVASASKSSAVNPPFNINAGLDGAAFQFVTKAEYE